MTQDGWTRTTSPFHDGERAVQERLGVRARIEQQGRRFIREYLTEQQREFYPQLPFVLLGSVDAAARPWASILTGPSGFIQSPDPHTLTIAALPPSGDPLASHLAVGVRLGVLGIEFATRRRNRANGRVAALDPHGVTITMDQTFGNCPKYIRRREHRFVAPAASTETPVTQPLDTLGETEAEAEAARRLVTSADTFFIATHTDRGGDPYSEGVDVSHRGGSPGFVRVEDARTLIIPDYIGNSHFNTLGNLHVNPRAGLLFIDFASGTLLSLTGVVEILWDPPEQPTFEGAERLLRFRIEEGLLLSHALPLRWEPCE